MRRNYTAEGAEFTALGSWFYLFSFERFRRVKSVAVLPIAIVSCNKRRCAVIVEILFIKSI